MISDKTIRDIDTQLLKEHAYEFTILNVCVGRQPLF